MIARQTDRAAGDAFWRFSLALYARPGVAEALLALQDRAGCEVNLILFALWAGVSRRQALDSEGMARAAAAIAPIADAIVAPLRRLRRELKRAAGADAQLLRRRILGLEIAAERQAQYRLAASLPAEAPAASGQDAMELAAANLAVYLGDHADAPEAGVLCQAIAALTRRADGDSLR